jgi:hypothetical protein
VINFIGGPNSLKRFNRLTISLICTFAFSFSFTAAAYADDCSSAGFKAAANITLDTAPFAIAAADFNGDDHLDLVYVPNDSSQQALVLYGRGGTEKFGPPSNVPVGLKRFRFRLLTTMFLNPMRQSTLR